MEAEAPPKVQEAELGENDGDEILKILRIIGPEIQLGNYVMMQRVGNYPKSYLHRVLRIHHWQNPKENCFEQIG